MPTEEQLKQRQQDALRPPAIRVPAPIERLSPEARGALDRGVPLREGVPVQEVITATDLTPSAPNIVIPPIPTTITESFTGKIDSALQSLLGTSAPSKTEETQTDLQKRILDITEQLGGQKARKAVLEKEAGLPAQRQELQGIMGQLQSLQKESAAIPLQIQQEALGRGVTRAGVEPIQTARLRDNTIKSLELAAVGQTLQGNISLAESTIKNALDVEFEPEETKLKVLEQLYTFNKDALERIDKKRADQLSFMLGERTRVLEQQKQEKSASSALALAATKNFPNDPTVQRAAQQVLELNSNDPLYLQKAFNLVGAYQSDPISVRKALDEHLKTQAEIDKINAEVKEKRVSAILNVPVGVYQNALSVILGSGKFTKEQKADIINAVNSGNDPGVVIKNQAKSILGQTGENKLTSFEVAKQQLLDVDSLLAQYYAQGGKTSLLSGKYEKVINKLGTIDDPKLVEISTQIAAALQIYRNAVSGTAYSVQEGVDIASIFPGIDKTEGLNKAILKGRMNAFDSTIDTTYKTVLGDIYDQIKALEEAKKAPIVPKGTRKIINNRIYVSDGTQWVLQ